MKNSRVSASLALAATAFGQMRDNQTREMTATKAVPATGRPAARFASNPPTFTVEPVTLHLPPVA
jgi:hypothetical protein